MFLVRGVCSSVKIDFEVKIHLSKNKFNCGLFQFWMTDKKNWSADPILCGLIWIDF
jgi:hypothetical protein